MAAKKKPMKIVIKHPGAFKKKAKKAGKTVAQEAEDVLKPGSHATKATKKQAQFAKNAKKWHHPKKKP